jgi:arylsulfatase A-like enzyme
MTRTIRSQMGRAAVNGVESALAYAALANALSFVRPMVGGPAWEGLAGIFASTVVLMVATVVSAIVLVLMSTFLGPAGGDVAWRTRAIAESGGTLSLGFGALGLALSAGNVSLAMCAVLSLVSAASLGLRSSAPGTRPRRWHWDCWMTALLLVVVPFLAEVRLQRNWGPLHAGAAAAAAASFVVLAAVTLARGSGRPWSATWATAWLVLASIGGWFGPEVLHRAPKPAAAHGVARVAPAAMPNVILIVLDTVRADHTSLYDSRQDTTPALRAFWQAGATVYTRAIATSDWTLPSTASIMTGLLPTRHGALTRGTDGPHGILPTLTTLAEHLSRSGLRTYGVAANSSGVLDARLGFGRGFDYYQSRPPRNLDRGSVKPYFLTAPIGTWLPLRWRMPYRRADDITAEALELLIETKGVAATPFFLFLNYMDAHDPYAPPRPYRQRFGGPRPSFSVRRYAALTTDVLAGKRHVRPEERQELEADYDAGIAYIDHSLHELFEQLRQRHLFDSSLIVVTADHGEMFGESDIVGHGAGLYPELVHVPLLIKYPGQHDSRTDARTVSGVDILATVLATVKPNAPTENDGHNLQDRAASDEGVAIAESFERGDLPSLNERFRGDERAAFFGPYVFRVDRTGRETLQTWRDRAVGASTPPPLSPPPSLALQLRMLADESRRMTLEPVVAPDIKERLRGLGYLGR